MYTSGELSILVPRAFEAKVLRCPFVFEEFAPHIVRKIQPRVEAPESQILAGESGGALPRGGSPVPGVLVQEGLDATAGALGAEASQGESSDVHRRPDGRWPGGGGG